jgi:hypothetical protein
MADAPQAAVPKPIGQPILQSIPGDLANHRAQTKPQAIVATTNCSDPMPGPEDFPKIEAGAQQVDAALQGHLAGVQYGQRFLLRDGGQMRSRSTTHDDDKHGGANQRRGRSSDLPRRGNADAQAKPNAAAKPHLSRYARSRWRCQTWTATSSFPHPVVPDIGVRRNICH